MFSNINHLLVSVAEKWLKFLGWQFQTEIKSSADKFFEVFSSKVYLIPQICPDRVKSIQLLEGDWNSFGSVKLWTYVAVRDSESAKEKLEAIDEQNKSITFNVLQGELMMNYKIFKFSFQVSGNGDGSLVNWALEYEKQNEGVPDPDKYQEIVVHVTKQIDAYLLKA
ncbi:hypothetical protein F0562_032623 [Nyssa sinensis]|uniref:Bet v I/Major latex protein domain-containing protein n=1 Tax=Nyssa sinensis TaxID=561372 RepID=A0A5J5AU89_9ASTE|nr:hypothetical protein F0562_032623 [Nyssa sinensis]